MREICFSKSSRIFLNLSLFFGILSALIFSSIFNAPVAIFLASFLEFDTVWYAKSRLSYSFVTYSFPNAFAPPLLVISLKFLNVI